MESKNQNEVIGRILNAARRESIRPVTLTSTLQVGQVRILSSLDGQSSPQLVVVARLLPADSQAIVILLSNLVEIATPRDFIGTMLDRLEHNDIVICADFFGSVHNVQLGNKVFGQACALCLKEILDSSLNSVSDTLAGLPHHGCFTQGQYKPLVGEEVWHMRNEEYALFYSKTLQN